MNKSITYEEQAVGELAYSLVQRLYPICRSITGNGVRRSLEIISDHIPLSIQEVASGTPVFDWTVPKEWNIKGGWIKDPQGKTIIDFRNHNLHVVNYSTPVHRKVSLNILKKHLHSLPDQPDLIPYRTTYYEENWGFCVPHRILQSLKNGIYEVFIDSSLRDGSLTYGEYYIPGLSQEEVLLSTHVCHPSLANDNLSGIAVMTFLARTLRNRDNHYSYRFLFIPGTIGSITWLALNREKTGKISHGLVASLLGDPGNFTYKKSRQGGTEIDRVVQHVLKHWEQESEIIDFIPYGYDERQYCSPGFNLPVGSLTRSQFGKFPEYHTSADNLSLVQPEFLLGSYNLYKEILFTLDNNKSYLNPNPYGEPQLGRRGLYENIGGASNSKEKQLATLWLLNLSDGKHTLLDIAEKSDFPFTVINEVKGMLLEKELLVEIV